MGAERSLRAGKSINGILGRYFWVGAVARSGLDWIGGMGLCGAARGTGDGVSVIAICEISMGICVLGGLPVTLAAVKGVGI
jgi:hypothetical protein